MAFLKNNNNKTTALILYDREKTAFICWVLTTWFCFHTYLNCTIQLCNYFSVSLTDRLWLFKLHPLYTLVHHPLFCFNNLKGYGNFFSFVLIYLISEHGDCDGNSWWLHATPWWKCETGANGGMSFYSAFIIFLLFLTVFESLEMLRRPTMPSFNEF